MTLGGIDIEISVNERGTVSVSAPEQYRALAALLETDLRVEGPHLYKVLARLYVRDDNAWKVSGNSCTLTVRGDSVTIVNNVTEDQTDMTRDQLLDALEQLRDELAFARARRRSRQA